MVYVWVDALLNYITALGYGSNDHALFDKYWLANVQLIGKEIVRFHIIYWLIILMYLGFAITGKRFTHMAGWT